MHRSAIEEIEMPHSRIQANWIMSMNIVKKVLINHLLNTIQVGPSQVWKCRLWVKEGSKTPNNLAKYRVLCRVTRGVGRGVSRGFWKSPSDRRHKKLQPKNHK